jgi:hypothetical protein
MEKNNDKKGRRDDCDRRDTRDRRNKVDVHHLDPRYTSSDAKTKNDDKNTYINDNDTSKLTASSDADDNNFAVALETPAKGEKKSKRGSTIAEKEVVAPCKRKSVAVTVPCKKKKVNTKNHRV